MMNVVEFIGLKVQTPMIINTDNKALFDMSNNWNVGGRTRHARHAFLRELKERQVIVLEWFPGVDNPSDMFTKNVTGPELKKLIVKYVGNDEYG